jgi:hypothetical protein
MYHIQFPPQSNRASWVFVGLITDLDGNPIDLTDCSIVFQISNNTEINDYSHPYPAGLTASTDNGKLTIVDLGTFRWFFTRDDMQGLCAGQHQTGLVITNDDGTQDIQLSVGPLPIVDGVVPMT